MFGKLCNFYAEFVQMCCLAFYLDFAFILTHIYYEFVSMSTVLMAMPTFMIIVLLVIFLLHTGLGTCILTVVYQS